MNILFLAAEVAPFVSVGGLSQFMYFLPQALMRLNNDVRIFTANYGAMDQTAPTKQGWQRQLDLENLKIPVSNLPKNNDFLSSKVLRLPKNKHNLTTYFLDNEEFFRLRANVYGYKD